MHKKGTQCAVILDIRYSDTAVFFDSHHVLLKANLQSTTSKTLTVGLAAAKPLPRLIQLLSYDSIIF